MRHALIILCICIASIGIGTALYLYGPKELHEMPPAQGAASAPLPERAEDVAFSVLAEGPYAAAMEDRKNIAVYSAKDFAYLWELAHGTDASAPPPVDFETKYVVGVFSGTRPSGGYGIMVDRVSDADAVRTVSITHTSPGADCMVTAALTSPYQMIVLPYSEKQLSRVEREAVVPCP